jgi:hypothetical protein
VQNAIETVYYLENPEKNFRTFATGSQLRYDDIIKDVFGVACINDLPMMIKYNKSFQDSICLSHGVQENEITLEMVIRVASKIEMQQLRTKYIDQHLNTEENQSEDIPCPFHPMIRLQEGIFSWDEENFSYTQVKTS